MNLSIGHFLVAKPNKWYCPDLGRDHSLVDKMTSVKNKASI